ncbi:S-adenosyl-L-methionine-dependent methyltransferase, partial [Peziza echinospora]
MHNLKPPPLTSTTSPSTVINPAPLDSGYVSVGSSTAPSASSSSPTKLSPALAAATSTIPPPPPAGGLEDENEDDEEDEEDQDLEESYDNNAKNLLIGAELIDLTTDTLKTETPHQPPTSTSSPRKLLSGIRLPALCSPRSAYEGYVPPHGLPISKERSVLREFLDLDDASTDSSTPHEAGEFTAYKLEEFCFYHPANDKRLALELCALDHLSVDRGKNVLLFDGVLINTHPTTGETIRRYVEGVPCTLLSIGNYEDLDTHSVAGAVWVQSQAAKGAGDIWYQLGSAEEGYGKRYHEPFLWLANFAKYFVDYLAVRGEEGTKVELADFKEGFGEWCESLHGGDEAFKRWKEMYVAGKNWGPKGGDFRQAVAVHYPFLWNQVYNVGVLASNRRMFTHTVWDEVMRLEAIKPAPGKLVNETIVTPLVYDCFYHIFGDKLKSMEPRLPREKQEGAKLVLEKAEVLSPEQAEVQPGDVVAVVKDEVSNWKGTSEYWYAYVQRVNKRTTGDTLDVIWLYLPEDTILGQMKYPYANELFFSDNCNCTDTRLRLDEVVFKVSTAMFCGPGESGAEYFVRQKFSDAEATFTTLKRVDLQCECSKPLVSAYEQARRTYTPGDTVLVESDTEAGGVLEPAQVVRFDEASQCVEMRQLFRRGRDFADLEDQTRQSWAPNELVYTEYLVLVPPQYISRRCYIRFIAPGCRPITPYDRGGTGDCFFIYQKRLDDGSLAPAYPPPEGFTQGFDPDAPPEGLTQLRGMDLYCGGGNFGRGIEEGGAVVNRWAVDFDVTALHTYRANLRAPAETQLYLGSVNNYLRDGLLGRFSAQVPPPGQVDFISAGSPCQGFSSANGDRDSERSLQNSSLVASVASFVDFYRPKFALLENVHGLAQDRIKKKDGLPYNVFSQLLCSLVAIGYQCQQFTLDAWSFGSCQTRTRLFVSIAAPGQLLPPRPGRSHEHPSTVRSKSLFEAPNGKKFGGRELAGPCTFPFVSTDSVIGSLPYLGDNHQGICIPFPDHRLSRIEARNTRLLMTHIPRHPRHLASLRRAINAGRVPPSLDFYRPTVSRLRDHSRSWSRISGEELCRTITTTITPQCNYTGRWMHYDQHRLLTVMEVRRVQSFPDDEVLLGGAVKTFKIVGNSVDRMVAVAWGVSIREA